MSDKAISVLSPIDLIPMRPLGGRHAAVIPALPDEYENLLPIGTLQYHEKQRNVPPPDPSRGLSYYPQHIIQQAQQERQQQEQRQPSQQVSPFTLQSLRYSRVYSAIAESRYLCLLSKRRLAAHDKLFSIPISVDNLQLHTKSIYDWQLLLSLATFVISIFCRHPVRLLVSSASDHLLRRMCHQSHLGRLPVFVVGLPSCSSQSHMQAPCTYRNHVLQTSLFSLYSI